MPTNRVPLRRQRRRLSPDELQSLLIGDGWQDKPPAFASDQARREAWQQARPLFMGRPCGQRPDAWWCYESPIPRPEDRDYERAALYEAQLLSPAEVKQALEWWRDCFEQAQEPGFSYCTGDAWLTGQEAQQAQYRWAGIPRGLLRQWQTQRRRRRASPPLAAQ
jgi:hypothetical protein